MTLNPDCPMVCIRNPYAENGLFLAAMFETHPVINGDLCYEMQLKAIPVQIFVDIAALNDMISIISNGCKKSFISDIIW